ncbi:MAG: type II and III secretion system protein, partial [Omnitrophica bacterium]|nr:type II and III secretion system protein [Candidatus Omnitrophota bacterium]
SRQTSVPFPTRLVPPFTPSVGADGTFTLGSLAFDQLKVVMNFLSQETTTKFLARPKILTLSNETAEVNLTVDEAIGLTTTSSQGVETQNVEREETGTKLRVTPQVNLLTNEITLFVEMFNRESTDSGLKVSGLTTGSGNVKNIEERSTKSLVRLKNGETLYIGGLIKRETTVINKKVPFLGDLPFVGRLFRYRESPEGGNQDRELLVFLTPRIMPDNSARVKKAKIFPREQQNDVKDESVRLALDSFSR